MGLEKLLLASFGRPVVPTFLFELFNSAIRSKVVSPAWRQVEKRVLRRSGRSELETPTQFLESILNFIKSECELAPLRDALKLSKDALSEWEENIGATSTAAALEALGRDCILVTDDDRLRRLAPACFRNVQALNTQQWLWVSKELDRVAEADYLKAVVSLVELNYGGVGLGADCIIWGVQEQQMEFNDTTRKLIGKLGRGCPFRPAVNVACQVLKSVWISQIPVAVKNMYTVALFQTLLSHAGDGLTPRGIRSIFLNVVHQDFALLHLQRESVANIVRDL